MKNLPSIELLESTHTFPCRYMFKVFGFHGEELIEQVRDAAAAVSGGERHVTWSYRTSGAGKHGCVTLDVWLQTAHHVQAMYTELQGLTSVRMLM
jgi:putative lipoic acid-binding regulatory protein